MWREGVLTRTPARRAVTREPSCTLQGAAYAMEGKPGHYARTHKGQRRRKRRHLAGGTRSACGHPFGQPIRRSRLPARRSAASGTRHGTPVPLPRRFPVRFALRRSLRAPRARARQAPASGRTSRNRTARTCPPTSPPPARSTSADRSRATSTPLAITTGSRSCWGRASDTR